MYRGAKSVISTDPPLASYTLVQRTGVFRTYSCSVLWAFSTSMEKCPKSALPLRSLRRSEQKVGSPSNLGKQHHPMRPCPSTSAPILPLPNSASSRSVIVKNLAAGLILHGPSLQPAILSPASPFSG